MEVMLIWCDLIYCSLRAQTLVWLYSAERYCQNSWGTFVCLFCWWISQFSSTLLKMCLSSRYWACPVASWAPFPAAEPSSARQSPCASGTGWRSSLVLSAGPEWSGRRGCSAATGSCRSAVEGNLSREGLRAFGGCGCCWCGACDGGCGPSSGGLWGGRFLSLGCPSSPCSDGKTKSDGAKVTKMKNSPQEKCAQV